MRELLQRRRFLTPALIVPFTATAPGSAYSIAFYNVYPSEERVCFYTNPDPTVVSSPWSTVGPIVYKGASYREISMDSIYIDHAVTTASNCPRPTALGLGKGAIGAGSFPMSMTNSSINTIGRCPSASGSPTLCTFGRESNLTTNGAETLLIMANSGVDTGNCSLTSSVTTGATVVQPNTAVSVRGQQCGTYSFRVTWECPSSSLRPKYAGNLNGYTCPGTSTQIALIGNLSDTFFPAEVHVLEGDTSCTSTCQAGGQQVDQTKYTFWEEVGVRMFQSSATRQWVTAALRIPFAVAAAHSVLHPLLARGTSL